MGMTSSMLPRVSVIGTGYLGLTHAVCMADLGHQVLAIDVDAEKIAQGGARRDTVLRARARAAAAQEPGRGPAAVHRLVRRGRRVR